MRLTKRLHVQQVVAAVGLLLATNAAVSQQSDRSSEGNRSDSDVIETQTEITFSRVVPAAELLGRSVYGKSKRVIGKIDEVVVDVHHGRVSYVDVVSENQDAAGSIRYAIVTGLFDLSGDGRLSVALGRDNLWKTEQNDPERSTSSGRMKDLQRLYEHYDVDRYWKVDGEETPERSVWLAGLKQLQDREIRSSEGRTLGRIQDVALVPDKIWRVGYLVLCECPLIEESDQFLPVPLGAFAADPESSEWVLDVPKEVLATTPTFSGDKWPKQIDRGWIEYVHVKYGRSVLDGVQGLD